MPCFDPDARDSVRPASGQKGMTLVAIPHAGGFGAFFAPLEEHLPETVRLLRVDLSGHGRRRHAPLLSSIETMARDVLTMIRPHLLRPYALFGHSMGALVAHQLLDCIAKKKLPPPRRLFVSSCPAPDRNRLSPGVARLPIEAFWAHVARFDGLPRRFFDHPHLMALFEPIFRADFRAVANYHPSPPEVLPEIPITVLHGQTDPISPEALAAWQAWTTGPITFRQFPGGHFYLIDQMPELAAFLAAQCLSVDV